MPEAKLTLAVPKGTWIGDLSTAYPEARVRILAALADEETGVGLAELVSDDLSDLLSDMADHGDLISVDVLERSDDDALVQFRAGTPLLLLAARGSGLPLEMPFEIQDGRATWTVAASRDSLSALGRQLDAFGVDYSVDYVQRVVTQEEQLLTDRQRWLVREALDRGYYDTPRTCSLTELADDLGMAKSTVSETLHRAEESIVKRFAAQYIPDEAPEPTV